MGMSQRDHAKRKAQQAIDGGIKIVQHLTDLKAMYGEGYEEYANLVNTLIMVQVQATQFLELFKAKHL